MADLLRAIEPFVDPATGLVVDPSDVYLSSAPLPVAFPSLFVDAEVYACDANGDWTELTG